MLLLCMLLSISVTTTTTAMVMGIYRYRDPCIQTVRKNNFTTQFEEKDAVLERSHTRTQQR